MLVLPSEEGSVPAQPYTAKFADEAAWKEFLDRLELSKVKDEARGEIMTSYQALEAGRVYTCELRARQVVKR